MLGVYTGGTVNALTLVASDTNSGGSLTSRVRFATIAGTTYYIAVDGYNGASGNITLAVTPSVNPPVRPVNDNFANAIVLSGGSPTASGQQRLRDQGAGRAESRQDRRRQIRLVALDRGQQRLDHHIDFRAALRYVARGLHRRTRSTPLSLVASNNDFGGST